MKASRGSGQWDGDDMLRALRWIPWRLRDASSGEAPRTLDVRTVHARHASFVWASLQRLGVRPSDLPDVHQEVFLVVHQKLAGFDDSKPLEPWLFGICRRKAASYRRRAWFRLEAPSESIGELCDASASWVVESEVDRLHAGAELDALLNLLDPDKRAVLVMFEIEGIDCETIAATMGVPVGTVYSRLHAARRVLEKAAERARVPSLDGGDP